MIVTEADAVELLCPMKQTLDRMMNCDGTRCMAWRVAKVADRAFLIAQNSMAETVADADGAADGAPVPSSWTFSPYDGDNPAGWVESDNSAARRNTGYCGMAGRIASVDVDAVLSPEFMRRLRDAVDFAQGRE